MKQSTASNTETHALSASARDRWLRRLAEDAIDTAEQRNLRAAVVATANDSPQARLARWLAEPRW
jgi:hypothetical protein